LQTMKPLVQVAYEQALAGHVWEALSLNGLIYSSAQGYNPQIAIDALTAGAIAAGLCGKGPAVTAVTPREKVDAVKSVLQNFGGEIIIAKLNRQKAKVL
jgi:shikimate kinase